MSNGKNGETEGADRTSLDAALRAVLEPPEIPPEINRGHFALFLGKLTAQQALIGLIAQRELTKSQRARIKVGLDRGLELAESVRGMKISATVRTHR